MRENIKIKLLQGLLEEVTRKYDYFLSQQEQALHESYEKATKDQLTGLYNRVYLDDYVTKVIQRVERKQTLLVIIFIDLDNFKFVNDTYGHKSGDEVLMEVGKLFRSTFRSYDVVVRYGGDEFIVFLEDKKYNKADIETLMHRFVSQLESSLNSFGVSASYGIAVAPQDGEDFNKLLALADERMYEQKQARKAKKKKEA